ASLRPFLRTVLAPAPRRPLFPYTTLFRSGLMHLVHSLWPKIVQGDDTCHHGSECGGDLRIADIGNVLLAFGHKMTNLRLESPAHLRGGPGEIDKHAAGINHIHAKSVRLKPRSDAVE